MRMLTITVLTFQINGHEIALVDVKQKLDYASAEFLKEKVVRFLNQQDIKIHLAVIRGEEINSIDYTVAMVSSVK